MAPNLDFGIEIIDPPLEATVPPLFESMMQAERERTANHLAPEPVPTAMAMPTPKPAPAHQNRISAHQNTIPDLGAGWGSAEQEPQQPQQPQQPPPTPMYESPVNTRSPSTFLHAEVCTFHTHQNTFMASLLSLWDDRLLCDLRLIPTAENKPNDVCISVHSAVIASASEEIKKILVNCVLNNGQLPPDLVVHVETNALEELVRYMYTGELRVHDGSVQNIMHAADTLGVGSATELCVQFLGRNITAANALSVSDMAIRFNRPELKEAVEGYLLKNIQHLVQESDFLELPVERVKELLSSDEAHFTSELDVFQAVVRWCRHDEAKRIHCFAALMQDTVRLPLMTPEELLDDVEGNDLVSNNSAARSLVYEIYRYQALPESRRDSMEIRGTNVRRCNAHGYRPGHF